MFDYQTRMTPNPFCTNDIIIFILLQGTEYDSRYPILITMILLLCGVPFTLLLPETLNQKLPDTLEDAKSFGNDQVS